MPKDAHCAQPQVLPGAGAPAHGVPLTEHLFRPVDHLDYLIRRWLIPVRFNEPSRATPPKKPSVQQVGNILHAIGQCLRAEYALESSIPDRLASLLKQFEQRNVSRAAMTRRPGLAGS
jgi:hypothetical protein